MLVKVRMKKNVFRYLKDHPVRRIDRNILSYGICVVIAVILWFLNALNKDYTSEISYPVKYTNLPRGKYLVSELPERISLEVKAKGFSLLGYQIRTSFQPIVFDVNAYTNHSLEKNNTMESTVQLNAIKDKISNQLSSDIKLQSIKPEKINFRFSRASVKKVAVQPVVHYTVEKQYILKDRITAVPDSIEVSGPALLVDTLRYVYTEPWYIHNVSKDISRKVALVEQENLFFEEKEIKVNLELERFTEAKKTVPIQILNLPPSLNMRLFPNQVDISYDVGLSRYDKITETDFNFTVDYQKYAKSSFAQVEATRVPAFIKNLKFTPQKVEFILEEK